MVPSDRSCNRSYIYEMFLLYMKCDQNVQEALFGRKDVEMLLESVQN